LDRTYDLLALRGIVDSGRAVLNPTLADPETMAGGRAATGIVKLAQRVALLLLTARGSRALEPDVGTDFLNRLRSGALQSEADVYASFQFAAGEIVERLRRETSASAPRDEQLVDLELQHVALAPGQLWLTVALTSAAGAARELKLPVPLIDGGISA